MKTLVETAADVLAGKGLEEAKGDVEYGNHTFEFSFIPTGPDDEDFALKLDKAMNKAFSEASKQVKAILKKHHAGIKDFSADHFEV